MRIKQKIIETPAQRILETSDMDTNSSNKVKLKNQKTIFPLRYESDGLLLRELKPMLVDAARSSKKPRRFFKEECNGELERIKHELKYRLENNDSYRENLIELYVELSNSYFDALIYMDGLIEKSFDEAIDDSERKIILDMLMIGGDGYSNLLDKVLKNGEEDKRYIFCLEYMKALSAEAKKDIVLTAWCDEGNNKKTKNLAKSLSRAFGEDYIITTINEYVKVNMGDVDDLKEDSGYVDAPAFYGNISLIDEEDEEDDDYYAYATSAAEASNQEENVQAFYNELENIADRQRLLLAILRNSEKQRTGELIVLFNTAVSWKLIKDSVETAVKAAKGNKKQLSEFFLEIAKNLSKNMEPAPVSYGLNAYAYLSRDKAPQVLKEIVKGLDEPIIAHNFVYSMLDLCGKEGQKAVKEIIKDDIKANRKSPVLFFLCGIANVYSKENEIVQKVAEEGEIVQGDDQGTIQEEKKEIACAAKNILREIFSMDEDIAEFIKMNVEKKTGVVREFHQEWIMCELIFPKVRDITNCFDIKRLAEWMMYSNNPNLRDNIRNLLAKALYENEESQDKNQQKHQFIKKLKDFIQDGIKGKSKTAVDFVKRFAGSI